MVTACLRHAEVKGQSVRHGRGVYFESNYNYFAHQPKSICLSYFNPLLVIFLHEFQFSRQHEQIIMISGKEMIHPKYILRHQYIPLYIKIDW